MGSSFIIHDVASYRGMPHMVLGWVNHLLWVVMVISNHHACVEAMFDNGATFGTAGPAKETEFGPSG